MADVDARRAPSPAWDAVRYMVAAVQYGGRVTHEYDQASPGLWGVRGLGPRFNGSGGRRGM